MTLLGHGLQQFRYCVDRLDVRHLSFIVSSIFQTELSNFSSCHVIQAFKNRKLQNLHPLRSLSKSLLNSIVMRKPLSERRYVIELIGDVSRDILLDSWI